MNPTIFLVDDDQAFLRSTTRLFESEELPVAAFRSGEEFFENYETGRPGCLLLDLMMPDMTGLEVLDMMRELDLSLPTIVMTAFGNVQSAVKAIKLGALDFVEKPIHNNRELLELVRRTLSSGLPALQAQQEIQRTDELLQNLTDREREVLDSVVNGLSSREIASEFGLSLATVNSHRVHILEKMQVGTLKNLIGLISRHRFAQQPPREQKSATVTAAKKGR